ncbi:MAG: M20/M25/M40 family metallo-hydrolase [Candidatus Nealsonbacteria bacterium]|nr:M20/M25/M40 family metallo-hydrolase [Candidatus Nealsonbacteria bacterium]
MKLSAARPRLLPRVYLACMLALLWTATSAPFAVAADEAAAAVEKRLADAARYLSSEELEGRGVETKGLELAAKYIAEQFEQAGLKTDLFDGTPMQEFKYTTSAKIGHDNKMTLVGPPGDDEPVSIELKPLRDFAPMSASGGGKFDLPLVFVGYGITGTQEKYDDFAGVDVKDKMVVILRHEPQQDDPESVFNGTKDSAHAPLRRKIANAFEHGAAGVIFCTDRVEVDKNLARMRRGWQKALDRLAAEHAKFKAVENPTMEQMEIQHERIEELIGQVQACGEWVKERVDPVQSFATGGSNPRPIFPVVHCRREVLDRVVRAALDTDLATLEQQIDKGLTPQSRELTGWRATGRTDVARDEIAIKNVVGVLEGEGPLAEETIVIGAHYDHLGYGRGAMKTVYNGADDNASGTAAMIEIARTLTARQEKLRRRIVFIAFTAEERGLVGSRHYVDQPMVPLEKTVAMLNLDMVGRLRDDKLMIFGSGSAKQFDGLLERLGPEHGLELVTQSRAFGSSDHASFSAKKIPAMHFITGKHTDLHKPTDDFEKLNVPGMRRVERLVADVAVELANADARPEYVSTGPRPSRGGNRPYLGTIPNYSAEGPGYAVSSVVKDSPAEKGGVRDGDAIIRFGTAKIGGLVDIVAALSKQKPGDRVKVVVRRGKEEITLEVTLAPPR